MRKFPRFVGALEEHVLPVVLDHKICIAGLLVGCLSGLAGILVGGISGYVADAIVLRICKERRIRRASFDGVADGAIKEPFSGCLYLCSLVVYCVRDPIAAELVLKSVLSKFVRCDWNYFCSSVGSPDELNGDLLTECLASVLIKQKSGAAKQGNFQVPIYAFFEALRSAELSWNEERFGRRPSEYLSLLLDYKDYERELGSAYEILGLKPNSPFVAVKKTYRKLAAKYHPDKSGSDTSSTFINIKNAYEKIAENQLK